MIIEKIFIKRINDLDSIHKEWIELEKGSEMTVYQSYSWNKILLQEHFNTFMHDFFTSVVIYVMKDNNKIILILPLIVQKKNNKTKWFGRNKGVYILGHGSYSDYLNAIYEKTDEKVFELLFKQLKSDLGRYKFNFTDLIEGTEFERFLEAKGVSNLESTVSVAVKKQSTAEDYTKMLSKHVRQNLRTAINRMNKDSINYEYRIIWNRIDEKELLDQLRRLHIERMREKNSIDIDMMHKVSSIVRIIYRKRKELTNNVVYESMKTMENSVFVIVYLNKQLSGYLYGLQDNNTIRIMQNCFDSKYKFYSPMFRGAYDFIISCYDKKEILSIDFTRGNESYKYQLAGVETILKHYSGRI